MANMATRVQGAWDQLRERVSGASVAAAEEFRTWLVNDLLGVSKKLPPLLEDSRQDVVWQALWERPLNEFAIRRAAWDEFLASLGETPSSFDPVRVFKWARRRLWSLCTFIDPDEACDMDQFELELWWSEVDQRAAFVCGMGHRFEFRRRNARTGWPPHAPWAGDCGSLRPANREIASRLFPDIELLA